MATNGESTGGRANSAVPIGFVNSTTGVAKATGADGSKRILQAGDPVFADDRIETGPNSSLAVESINDVRLVLGASEVAVLDTDVIDPAGLVNTADAAASIESIQQAILASEDATKEPTVAADKEKP